MVFKILAGTELYDKILAISERMREAHNASLEVVKRLGYTSYIKASDCVMGGISGIKIPDGRPYGWKRTHRNSFDDCYMPANVSKNKDLIKEIESLPVVTIGEYNKIFEYDYMDLVLANKCYVVRPGFKINKDKYIVVDFGCVYTYQPLADMVEITREEYDKLVAETLEDKLQDN